ncbi:MAG: fumarylacetoacetate hydrolase family protein [Gemmataceae bacterium]|nr:fumarylacetoacetate hydrolase family protein [Gemmataceae bacterium]
MRLATLHTTNGPRVHGRAGSGYVDLNEADPSLPATLRGLLAAGPAALDRARAVLQVTTVTVQAASAHYAPVIPDAGKIVCIGLNYRDHAIEGGKAIPTEPVLFAKYSNTLIAHGDTIRLPRVSEKVDYEAELVCVIGKRGRDISEADAMSHVAGWTCGHDVSARDWQFRGAERQWTIGKTFDTFAPTGPEMVTIDELPDPHALQVQMRLNGQTMQNSNTREFIFTIQQLIAFVSQVITLEPGDIMFTGTPPGVGGARKPPVWLKPGDVCEVEIEKIGVLRNQVAAAE